MCLLLGFKDWILIDEEWGLIGQNDMSNADGQWSAKVRSNRQTPDRQRDPDRRREGEATAEDLFGVRKTSNKCKKK